MQREIKILPRSLFDLRENRELIIKSSRKNTLPPKLKLNKKKKPAIFALSVTKEAAPTISPGRKLYPAPSRPLEPPHATAVSPGEPKKEEKKARAKKGSLK